MTTGKISILSPMYTEDERWVANVIKTELERGKQKYTTYQPYTDGLERQLFEFLSSSDNSADASEAKRAILLSSALNFYNIIQASDACVLVCDGRTPDEGSVFWAAVAFASGKPVVLYKSDYRTFMSTGDNSMVTGLCLDYEPVKDIKNLNDRVESHIARYSKNFLTRKADNIPVYNYLLQILGEKVWTSYKGRSLRDILTEMKNDPLVENLIPDDTKEYKRLNITGEKVYCSGPLFCPAEIREITKIAKTIEFEGLTTYLPHRDGVEAMMGDLDNSFLRGEAIKGHMADINSFTIDVYQLMECRHFVINLNGRTPDDGAVAEAGMAFAMGRPNVLYRSDSRAFFGGFHGLVHPALQMAGHLFDITADCNEIYGKLVRQAAFMKTVDDYCEVYGKLVGQDAIIKAQGNRYTPEIHQEVRDVYLLGQQINSELLDIYTGEAPLWNRFTGWRVFHTATKPETYFRFWREYHPYSTWGG